MRKGNVLRWGAFAALSGACAAWAAFPPAPATVERIYSTRLFPAIAAVLVPVVGAVPFSVSAALLPTLAVAFAAWVIVGWKRGGRRGETRPRRLFRVLEASAWTAVVAYALFVLLWAANYRRERARDLLGLDARPVEPGEVRAWIDRLEGAVARDSPPEAARLGPRALESLRLSLQDVLSEWHGVRPSLPARVKRLPAGSLLAFGTGGVTTPILEPHVDGGEPEVEFLATAAHELAHVGGICGEADADLASALAGLRADDVYARYAVELSLLLRFARNLSASERGALRDRLPAPVREDIAAMDAARERYRIPPLAAVQRRVYDTYLRSQGVRDGVREYAQIVELLVAAGRKGLIEPLNRDGRSPRG